MAELALYFSWIVLGVKVFIVVLFFKYLRKVIRLLEEIKDKK